MNPNLTRTFCLLLFFFYGMAAQAQTRLIRGTVLGQNDEVLTGASVRDTTTGRVSVTDRRGVFTIQVDSKSVLTISYIGYTSTVVDQFSEEETLPKYIRLTPEVTDLSEFEVRSSAVIPVAEEATINVLDYLPYRDFTLTLETKGRKRYLAFYQKSDSVERFPLNEIKGRSLFRDCFGNVHVLSDDSAYQVYIDDRIRVIATTSMKQFDENIRACVADFDQKTFFEGYTRSNKMYSLWGYQNGGEAPECYLKVWDKTGEYLAKEDYDSIINLYHSVTSPLENVILNKSWDGNLTTLAHVPGLVFKIGWYTKVSARPIEVRTFASQRQLVAFNCFSDTITVLDSGGKVIRRSPFGSGKEKVHHILHDNLTSQFYLFMVHGSDRGIHAIDTWTGNKEFLAAPKGMSRYELPEIYDGHLYFILSEGGYGNLYRVDLEELK